MRKIVFLFFLALLASCSQRLSTPFTVIVSNDQSFARTDELVEVPISAIAEQLTLIGEEQYIILDADGCQVPYQITYDHHLLFPATVPANDSVAYTIIIGEPIKSERFVYGRHYPESAEDITWENDRMAYCVHGELEWGYDVWAKRVPHLVVEQRYANYLNPGSSDARWQHRIPPLLE